jgi:hypothetical protein
MSRSDDLVPANQASVLRCSAVLEAWIGARHADQSGHMWLSHRESRAGWTRRWRSRRSDRTVILDGAPDGYEAMADRDSIKVLITR